MELVMDLGAIEAQLDKDYAARKSKLAAQRRSIEQAAAELAQLEATEIEREEAAAAMAAATEALLADLAAMQTMDLIPLRQSSEQQANEVMEALNLLRKAHQQFASLWSQVQSAAATTGRLSIEHRGAFATEAQRLEWCDQQIDALLVPVVKWLSPELPDAIRREFGLRGYLDNLALDQLRQIARQQRCS